MAGHFFRGAVICALMSALFVAQAKAQSRTTAKDWIGKNDFGGSGLIQTRTARMAPDGTFEAGYSRVRPYKRYFVSMQALPWLEGTFRYTEIENRLFTQFEFFSGKQTFKDRGADLTFRLLEESKYLPAVALTFQDGLGTGQFSGEYLTASKAFYDLDFSGGIAWGYPTSGSTLKNPLAQLSSVFANRTGGARTGGQFSVGSYFSGPNIAPFGGVAYRTPIDGLTLKWEYDPNDYQNEPQRNVFDKGSPYNFGVLYRPFPWLETSLSYERGNLTTIRVSMRSNIHDKGMPKFDPPPPKLKSRAEVAGELSLARSTDQDGRPQFDGSMVLATRIPGQSPDAGPKSAGLKSVNLFPIVNSASAPLAPGPAERPALTLAVDGKAEFEDVVFVEYLFDMLEQEGLRLETVSFDHSEAEIKVSRANSDAETSARAAQIVLRVLPTPVDKLTIVMTRAEQEVYRTAYTRNEIERSIIVDDLFDTVEGRGMAVGDIEMSGQTATLTIVAAEIPEPGSFSDSAKAIAEAAPTTVKTVTVVAFHAEVEVARVTLQRTSEDDSSGLRWAASGSSGTAKKSKPTWSEEDKKLIAKRLFDQLDEDSFLADAMKLEGHGVTVYGTPRGFRQYARNIGRTMRGIANSMPPEIEEMTLVSISAGMEMNKVTIRRKDLERAVNSNGSPEEIWATSKIEGGDGGIFLPDGAVRNWGRYPKFRWSLSPRIRSHIGGPDQFLLYQFWVSAGASIEFWRGLGISGLIGRDVYNNFDRITLLSDSGLQHVRSDIGLYLKEGENNIVNLHADYLFSPAKEWYVRVSAGIFEEMFGGYGAEVLHRPFNSRFAIGFDINKVWQREFEQRFRFQEYNVVTGHLNVYYQLPWYNLLGTVNIGQYLAGDKGVTYNLSRLFDSGVRLGVWATLTDISAASFGEGSFDKGFFITLPFELFLTKSSTKGGSFAFRPLFRDGGQTLAHGGRLYDVTSAANYREVFHDWHRFLD
jgi:hypothetical protein